MRPFTAGPTARGPVIVVIGVVLVSATIAISIYLWRHEAPNRRRTMDLMRDAAPP